MSILGVNGALAGHTNMQTGHKRQPQAEQVLRSSCRKQGKRQTHQK